MNDFTERYKEYSNLVLLKIIDNPEGYQPSAVVAAQEVLDSRQLSNEEMETAKTELAAFNRQKETQDQKKKELENKVKDIGASVFSAVNPIQTDRPSTDRLIKIVCIVFGAIFLIQLYKDWPLISFMFTDGDAKWDLSMVLYFSTLIIVPVATFLFLKRKKLGWTLFAILLTYSTISTLGIFIMILKLQPSGIGALDKLFPPMSPMTHFVVFVFFAAMLLTICKKEIRDAYAVGKKHMFLIIGIIGVISMLLGYEMFT